MDKKMTSGEIAKKAGVSQKAVRLYDEKGLLKPSDYSEGNYRLYDTASLQILEKIVALKQIGIDVSFIDSRIKEQEAERAACEEMLKRYFGRAEVVILPTVWRYDNADEIVKRMQYIFGDQEKAIERNRSRILSYFEKKIESDGEVKIETKSEFWHCGR